MRKIGAVFALTAAVACVAFLGMKFMGGSSSSLGGIAVVDLDKVAAATGKSQEMRDALKLQESSMNQKLVGFRNAAITELQNDAKQIKELEEKSKDLDEKSDNSIDKKDLDGKKYVWNAKLQKANSMLAQAQNEAGSALNQMLQVQIAKFRAELKPIVQDAAAKRGLSVVIPKNDGLLLSVEPGVDITEDVIKAYLSKRPAPTTSTPAAPAASTTTAAAPTAASSSQTADTPVAPAAQSTTAPSRAERSTTERSRTERPTSERAIPADSGTASDEDPPVEKSSIRRKQSKGSAQRNKSTDSDSDPR